MDGDRDLEHSNVYVQSVASLDEIIGIDVLTVVITGLTEEKKPIVLWKKPLIEIIDDMIFIDDILVWRNGEFMRRKDDESN